LKNTGLCYLTPRIFINVPINCPSPDHIYHLASPQESRELLIDAGLKILCEEYFPMTGYTMERATKLKATVSCNFIAARGDYDEKSNLGSNL
jgi:hypothetical protein